MVHNVSNHIVRAKGKDEKCVAIILDLAKALNAVSVPRLCIQLERLGIRDKLLKLFELFFECHTMCTNERSSKQKAPCITWRPSGKHVESHTIFSSY